MRVNIRTPKIRPPRILPRRPHIIVGIPTLNEEDSIARITEILDKGLSKFFPDKKALIINIDSNSEDDTRRSFLSAKTKTPTQYIKTPNGKGAALRVLFEEFLKTESAEVLLIIDADAKTASPRWIKNLATPILKGFDHVFPVYTGHEYDASITNHFCYPVVRGVLGYDLRQLRTGETAMSRRAVDRLYNRTWPPAGYKFGIDILSPLSSIFAELRIAESYLGERYHTTDLEKLKVRFEQRAATLFEKLDKRTEDWKREVKHRKPPLFFKGDKRPRLTPINIDYKGMRNYAMSAFASKKTDIKKIVTSEVFKKLNLCFKTSAKVDISADTWADVVYSFVLASDMSPSKRAAALSPLYFARFSTFYRQNLDKNHRESHQAIIDQADLFYKKRGVLLK